MIPWIPLSVLSDFSQPTSPVPDDVQPSRYPLGFSDVRAHAEPAFVDAPADSRPQIGFAPAVVSGADARIEPVFRTELSFRRTPRPAPVVRAEVAPEPSQTPEPVVGHASVEPAAEPPADAAPSHAREIGFAPRHTPVEIQPVADVDEVEEPDHVAAVDDVDAADPIPEAELEPEPADVIDLDEDVAEPVELSAEVEDADLLDVAEPEIAEPAADEPMAAAGNGDGAGSVADAEPAGQSKRSWRSRGSGDPKPKRRGSGRGDRGGRRVVGLKIGASQLAAAVVHQVDGRSELHALARVPLEQGIVVDGEVKDATALTHALKAFFGEFDLPRKDVRIGLASNRIGVRTFDIGGIDDEERFDNAVRFKAHEVLPVAVHESLLDYRVIDERASESGEPLRRVLLAVAPRDQVEPYLAVLEEAGVKVAGVDLEALGLLRAFVEPRPFAARTADDTATVVASIGHEASTLLVSGGGACEFTRVFDWGGATLQDAIAQELDVHTAEAGTILRHLALTGAARPLASLDDESRARAMDAVRSRLTPFARELVSSLQFYQTQQGSLGIGEIVITGGTSHLIGLADSLHQMIGVNVRVGDPLQRVVVKTGIDPATEATIGSLAVSIGLAIDDDSLRGVNLLPGEMRESTRTRPNIVKVALPVAAAIPIVALGFMFLQANGKVGDQQSQLDAVQAEIAALPKPKRPVIDEGVAATEAARAVALASVLGGRVPWDGVLRDVSLVLPVNVSLTKLEAKLPVPPPVTATSTATTTTTTTASPVPVAATGVTIAGYTTDQPAVARLMSRLRTVSSLTNVQLASSTRERVGRKTIVRFQILADIKPLGGAQ